jgi:nucleotide-binding universal stress UspA family protein
VIERVLLAVDDSLDSLAAARLAIELAATWHLRLRAVHVSADHVLDTALEKAGGQPAAHMRRTLAAATVLARVSALAQAAGVVVETELLSGDVGPAILEAVREWPADLVIVGKSARSASGSPYVGTQTRHVLEFADQPVLVVPPPPSHDR